MGPTVYIWVRMTSRIWKPSNIRRTVIKNSIERSLLDMVTIFPASLSCFFFTMKLTETHSVERAKQDLKLKFRSTYTKGLIFWTLFQAFNYALVSQPYQIVAASLASFLWTTFLSCVKQMDRNRIKDLDIEKITDR